MEKDFEIIDGMMNAIMQSETWTRIAYDNPDVAAEQKNLDGLMNEVYAIVPENLGKELENAVNQTIAAYSDAAALYGIHVAQTIQSVAGNQSGYAAYHRAIAAKRQNAG